MSREREADARTSAAPAGTSSGTSGGSGDRLVDFLVARLTEDLALLWHRDAASSDLSRPGLAAQLAVVDDMLTDLRAGRLPARPELRMLLFGYGTHPDYDPTWAARLGTT